MAQVGGGYCVHVLVPDKNLNPTRIFLVSKAVRFNSLVTYSHGSSNKYDTPCMIKQRLQYRQKAWMRMLNKSLKDRIKSQSKLATNFSSWIFPWAQKSLRLGLGVKCGSKNLIQTASWADDGLPAAVLGHDPQASSIATCLVRAVRARPLLALVRGSQISAVTVPGSVASSP